MYLIAPNSDLSSANLSGAQLRSANLRSANLIDADLIDANFNGAKLIGANLKGANFTITKNLTNKQIKSACFWDEAIYKRKWNKEKKTWITIEPDNTNFIEELKKDKSSDPEKQPDCSKWSSET